MSKNQFDLLGDDSLVKDYEKHRIINERNQPLLFRSLKEKEKSKKRTKRAEFELIYDIEYLWFIVLEFLPLRDLLRCSVVNKFTCGLIHSYNCYGEILKRDFFNNNENDKKEMGKIVKNIDNTGVFAYLIQDFIGKAKLTPQKLQTIKNTIMQEPDSKMKRIFGKIYLAIEEEIESVQEEAELLKQHVRSFLIEKLSKKKTENMKTKVKECAHNHCAISQISLPPFTFRLECLDCKVAASTNFRPENVFRKEVRSRLCRYRVLDTSTKFDKYVLNTTSHSFEFDPDTVYNC
ncbi:Hypothetical protein NAEGRDRAFT_72267 [Naegleria gruberi]|uniref:F-box domain-containing protein n=1 Tax=Naegleria gruberi TaxID=5762 RepID=D2VTE1_NAEGR|nr:uncharacterized protein NAEGRDRAFT_72267 [Naegleria gruberi]EFC39847.1 Hypothetical protein NAEGRDRAFT_72267 [Naegleria gruberi]|eukprot:XP_002672591.1 Hypothetical protein NAEGRDRAFT_72267 [Naegleria gruberi strain NEG-M]